MASNISSSVSRPSLSGRPSGDYGFTAPKCSCIHSARCDRERCLLNLNPYGMNGPLRYGFTDEAEYREAA